MNTPKRNKNILFYILVGYILIQFIWWELLLVKQSRQIFDSKEKLSALEISDPKRLHEKLNELKRKQDKYIYMILGEGTIFLIFISIGILRVYKSHRREKQIAQLQKNFLLSVSHELKTPLATTQLNLQTLIKRELPKEMQKEILEKSLQENERLSQLIENILMSTRLDDAANTGAMMLYKTDVVLADLITETISKTFSVPQQSRIQLNLDPSIKLNIDPTLFPSIIINLVENALKYSKETVSVVLIRETGIGLLRISDQGYTIPVIEREKIFDKFYRSGNEETRKNKGTGLGLFIVKKTVEMHNATITLYPGYPNGNVFEVKFVQ